MSLFPDEVEVKIKVKKATKPKTIDVNSAISKQFLEEYYVVKYNEVFSIAPRIIWGKDIRLINSLIKEYKDVKQFSCETPGELLIKVCDLFFNSSSDYLLKNAWNIQAFYYVFQTLVLKFSNKGKCIDPVIDGYKVAYFNHYDNKFDGAINDDMFMQVYVYLNSLQNKKCTLKKIAELFFSVCFDYMGSKKYNTSFFITNTAKELFQNWLTSDNNNLFFYSFEVGKLKIKQENTVNI